MINATALYYKYSRVLYTNSRVMYIGKLKTLLVMSREKQNRIDFESLLSAAPIAIHNDSTGVECWYSMPTCLLYYTYQVMYISK